MSSGDVRLALFLLLGTQCSPSTIAYRRLWYHRRAAALERVLLCEWTLGTRSMPCFWVRSGLFCCRRYTALSSSPGCRTLVQLRFEFPAVFRRHCARRCLCAGSERRTWGGCCARSRCSLDLVCCSTSGTTYGSPQRRLRHRYCVFFFLFSVFSIVGCRAG
jgi:hypothetical protein